MKCVALVGAGLALCLSTVSASATAVSLDTWYDFTFGADGSPLSAGTGNLLNPSTSALPVGPWEFTLVNPGTLFVQDVQISGDRFELFNSDVSIGSTSIPVNNASSCGNDIGCSIADSNFSRWTFALPAGSYSITGILLPGSITFGNGAFFVSSVAPVPVPAALPLLASGLGVMGMASWRSQKKNKLAA